MTESQEKDICNFIKECQEKKAIETNSLICYAGKLNTIFEAKPVYTKLMLCYSFIRNHGFATLSISHIGQKLPDNIENLKNSFY